MISKIIGFRGLAYFQTHPFIIKHMDSNGKKLSMEEPLLGIMEHFGLRSDDVFFSPEISNAIHESYSLIDAKLLYHKLI